MFPQRSMFPEGPQHSMLPELSMLPAQLSEWRRKPRDLIALDWLGLLPLAFQNRLVEGVTSR